MSYKIQNSVSLHVLCQFSIALFMKQLCIFWMASIFIFLIPFLVDDQISHFRFPLSSISHLIHQSCVLKGPPTVVPHAPLLQRCFLSLWGLRVQVSYYSTAPPCATIEPVHVSLEDILCSNVNGNNECNNEYKINISVLCCT